MTGLFTSVIVPVASPEDARATCRALQPHLDGGTDSEIVAVHVIEKAGGAPDKAGVEQREEYADEVFAAFRDCLGPDRAVATDLRFGTDVAETIFDAAADHDATTIVVTPRGGSRWIRLLTGDVALDLMTKSKRPVVVLPDSSRVDEDPDSSSREGDSARE